MREENYKPKMPDIMEAVFDAGYLIFDLVAAILFFVFSKGNTVFVLYGILTLTLCGGDAFHLVPRILRTIHGSNDRIKKQLGTADIIHYDDSLLHHSDVCVEIHFSGSEGTCSSGGNDMDLSNHKNRCVCSSTE